MSQIIKFDYSKYVKGDIDLFTTFNNLDFWKEYGLKIAKECAIRRLYIIPLPQPACH